MEPNTTASSQSAMVDRTRAAIHEHRTWFLIQGVIMIILGAAAILLPWVATLASAIFVGWLFIIGGVVRLVATFSSRRAPGFWWSIVIGILAIILGFVIVANPLEGVLTLTYALIILFFIEGIFQIIAAVEFRKATASSWIWLILSGVIDIVLAVLIFAGLPGTAAWAIGLLVGINLLFAGIALTMTALAANKLPG
ncbi:HdeD family acid-resistance protein [Microbaculum marinum]|uniref:HdeD family acid-resistance protein n=1 Tax=Microbaculum marinum TaxID=1764581 RepID=A0AAW9RR16_9HYPH